MLLLSNIIAIILLVSSIYAGIDKLIAIALYIGIIVASELLNKLADTITIESKIVKSLTAYFKNKYLPEKVCKIVKITAYCLFLLVWLSFLVEIGFLASGNTLNVDDSYNSTLFCVGVYVVLYFYSAFATRTLQESEDSYTSIKEVQWYRLLKYLSVYHFIFGMLAVFMCYCSEDTLYDYNLFNIFDFSIFAFVGLLFCLIMERIFDTCRLISGAIDNKIQKYEVPFFVSILAADSSFKHSLLKTIEVISGVDLSKSEMAGYIADHIEPVTIIALVIFWLLSSIVIIPPNMEAIFHRMGKIVGDQSYKPGIHFKLPWPIERITLYEPGKVNTINIGFKPDPTKKHLIWSKAHAAENFYALVGDGVEIISIDCQVFYKVKDLYKFVTCVQNPEDYIEAMTYKLITNTTVSSNFDTIMSQNRDSLISDLRHKLQKVLDDTDIGVNVVDIVILAIHPPLEVADVYEDVISAQIDKRMFVLKANAESIHKVHYAKATATTSENEAKSYAANAVANAIGEASAFESRIIGYNTDPELESFRLKLDSIQKMAQKKHLYVIDKTFLRDNDRIMLNLQN